MSSASAPTTGRYRTIDIVAVTLLGVVFGVVFWGWGKLYALINLGTTVGFPPASALLGGGWLIAAVVGGLIVQRRGAALATELVAAFTSMLLTTEWGTTVLVAGLLQGLGAELVFALFGYRRFGLGVAIAAGALAGVFEALYEWFAYFGYWDLPWRLAYLGLFAVSGMVIAGWGGWALTRALAKAGALDAFPAGRA